MISFDVIGFIRNPLIPSCIYCEIQETSETIGIQPKLIASPITLGKPSLLDGRIIKSHIE